MQIFSDETLAHYGLEYDNSLSHFGTPGMKWGIRKTKTSGKTSTGAHHLTDEQKSTIKKIAIGVGGAAVLATGIAIAIKFRKPIPMQNLNQKSIESGKKVVDRLIFKAAERPTFSVNTKGVVSKTHNNPAREASRLRRDIRNLDINKTLNYLRNESNVPLREGVARSNGEMFVRLMTDPKISSSEASGILAAASEIMYNSLRDYTQ